MAVLNEAQKKGADNIRRYVEGARCTRCGISEFFPSIQFDQSGICQLCKREGSAQTIAETRRALCEKVEQALNKANRRGDYDCIVAYSGGKDSSMTLLKLVRDHGLKCLAITIDNGFLSDRAVENCFEFTSQLGVDFTLFKPSFAFMKNMYMTSISQEVHSYAATKRASSVCNSCIGLINNHMIKTAISMDVPIIAGGYLGGQVPKDAAVMELAAGKLKRFRESTMAHYQQHFGDDAGKFFGIPSSVLEKLGSETLYVINPMLGWDYDVDEIIAEISKYGWRKPADTGQHSSNCRLNDVGIVFHLKDSGFHPYEAELTDLVRKGFMTREKAVAKLNEIPDLADYGDVMTKLDA